MDKEPRLGGWLSLFPRPVSGLSIYRFGGLLLRQFHRPSRQGLLVVNQGPVRHLVPQVLQQAAQPGPRLPA